MCGRSPTTMRCRGHRVATEPDSTTLCSEARMRQPRGSPLLRLEVGTNALGASFMRSMRDCSRSHLATEFTNLSGVSKDSYFPKRVRLAGSSSIARNCSSVPVTNSSLASCSTFVARSSISTARTRHSPLQIVGRPTSCSPSGTSKPSQSLEPVCSDYLQLYTPRRTSVRSSKIQAVSSGSARPMV